MLKKVGLALVMGLLAWSLAACGAGSGSGSGSGSGNDSGSTTNAEAAKIEAALSEVPGVADVQARYNVNKGMGSTLSVLIQADAGTAPLEPVMSESLQAFASAAATITGLNPNMGISFQVTAQGQENTINPTAVGLPQRPTIPEITEFANGTD